jgi:hypothetical protein
MNQDYVDTVRLLLAVAPAVFRPPRFALKGGTALNLFVQDMPRLSIDIDVVFTDHTLDREAALRAIAADRKSIKSAISAMGHRADLPTTKGGDEVKLIVEGNGVPAVKPCELPICDNNGYRNASILKLTCPRMTGW